jgi:hypothetical protein
MGQTLYILETVLLIRVDNAQKKENIGNTKVNTVLLG